MRKGASQACQPGEAETRLEEWKERDIQQVRYFLNKHTYMKTDQTPGHSFTYEVVGWLCFWQSGKGRWVLKTAHSWALLRRSLHLVL